MLHLPEWQRFRFLQAWAIHQRGCAGFDNTNNRLSGIYIQKLSAGKRHLRRLVNLINQLIIFNCRFALVHDGLTRLKRRKPGASALRSLLFRFLQIGFCDGSHVARLTAFKTGVRGAFLLVAAIAGTIRVTGMISHKFAHGIALPGAFEGMALLAGAFHKTLSLRIHDMMAGSAFNFFMRVMIENHRQARACPIVKQDGLPD